MRSSRFLLAGNLPGQSGLERSHEYGCNWPSRARQLSELTAQNRPFRTCSLSKTSGDEAGRGGTRTRPGTAAQERQLCYMLPNRSIDKCVLSLAVKQRNIGASSDAAMRQSVKG